ncbi:nitroreductase family deazaflavin-dependent oxidoreductase [Cryobacterium sp. PH29-G1]|uniref:nitroreductase family deazaflavin-dependent oxidoreductase n=1 Tax=Cryobacterium sp. PH29-G1 TaxID=3046211 RepID=UPI0024B8A48E|nr:nitroreductase family deazaflavin-dependent oxidoreductase [Cryobacterium sp. PH29-G1]MDJ0350778.1 nitroreductase family deazaflavin-dependent oxidoreductase [Cryobacterium sp. PH29-G1]
MTAQPALQPPGGVLRRLFHLPVYLFHARLGFLFGHRFLMLVHRGRKSGKTYETPLEVVHYDRASREAIVVAGWGAKSQWLHNVEAGLAQEIWIGTARYVPSMRQLGLHEAEVVFEHYEKHSGIPRRIVQRVLSRLLGWQYDGSPEGRRRVVQELPLIGFRPQEASADDR